MNCIFKKSKYYAAAVADPTKIIEPIGYHFFAESSAKRPQFKQKEGVLMNKYVSDKTIMKQISSRGIPMKQLQKFLKKSQSTRKNYYIQGTKQQFITQKLSYPLLIELRSHFFTKFQNKQLLEFLQLILCLSILSQNLFSIRDYALSRFFVYYNGSNKKFYDYLQEVLAEEFLQYETEILINEPKISRPQLRKVQITNKNEIIDYVNEVNAIGSQKDRHFSGAHLFISHSLPDTQSQDFFSEESTAWKYIFDQIVIMLSHLGDGQHAIFKIKGTYSHKTSELLFILKLTFSRIYLQKNIISNPFSNENYVICEYYNQDNGKIILNHIFNHYNQVISNPEMLLIDPNQMFNQDFQNNLKIYNDLSVITKNTTKELYYEFSTNSNIHVYPNKAELLSKISELKIKNVEQYLQILKEAIPEMEEPTKTQKKQEEIVEKEAVQFDFELLDNIFKQSNKKKDDKLIYDISKREADESRVYEDYLANAEKHMNMKKQKVLKKKKKEKTQDY